MIPFHQYRKKLANSAAFTCALYSRLDTNAIMLSFNTLRSLVVWAQDNELYENSLKKMYNEFTKESKLGGGGLAIQDSLRVTQNCFVELLSINRSIGYQLGFQYIRALCLHLRTIRNNLTKDNIKNIYSW